MCLVALLEGGEPVVVDYGNDVPTDDVGSGFPVPDFSHDIDPAIDKLDSPEYYKKSAWNLCKIARAKGSIMRNLRDRINGVNVPWLYFGMTFATFSWHTEDNWLVSGQNLYEKKVGTDSLVFLNSTR